VTAFFAGLALLFGPPSPVLASGSDQVTAERGSYCWAGERDANGLEPNICAVEPPPFSIRALSVGPRGRVRVDMGTDADSLIAAVRGRRGELPVTRVGGSSRRFLVQLPPRLSQYAVLDLRADYPKGYASFGAALAPPPPSAPPTPVLAAGGDRLAMARGSYCWSNPPVGLCVDAKRPITAHALSVRRGRELRVDLGIEADVVDASIRDGPPDLHARSVGASKRRFAFHLPGYVEGRTVVDLFVRYPEGDASFGARLRVR